MSRLLMGSLLCGALVLGAVAGSRQTLTDVLRVRNSKPAFACFTSLSLRKLAPTLPPGRRPIRKTP
jgi:hypothetical protein